MVLEWYSSRRSNEVRMGFFPSMDSVEGEHLTLNDNHSSNVRSAMMFA